MNDVKYFLVLEKRSGDYTIIDINKLDKQIEKAIVSIIVIICIFKRVLSICHIKIEGLMIRQDYAVAVICPISCS